MMVTVALEPSQYLVTFGRADSSYCQVYNSELGREYVRSSSRFVLLQRLVTSYIMHGDISPGVTRDTDKELT